jgi:hypothetical protein
MIRPPRDHARQPSGDKSRCVANIQCRERPVVPKRGCRGVDIDPPELSARSALACEFVKYCYEGGAFGWLGFVRTATWLSGQRFFAIGSSGKVKDLFQPSVWVRSLRVRFKNNEPDKVGFREDYDEPVVTR